MTGVLAPDFAFPTLDGHTARLTTLRGKIVVMNFWATWCAPCRVETPWLIDLFRRYERHGLVVLGVSMDDERKAVAAFAAERHVNYPILFGNATVAKAYGGIRFLPQTIFIGRDGRIMSRTFGMHQQADLENSVRRALNRP
jgi:peroxiredoxin